MDRELDPDLFGDRHDLAQEGEQVVAHLRLADAVEREDAVVDRLAVVGILAARQAGDDVALEGRDLLLAHRREARLRRLYEGAG